ncbi:MAG: ATP-binding protein [Chloroflexi bacterium]|nr:ATP-binding protein [Chloroflexota bacterium]
MARLGCLFAVVVALAFIGLIAVASLVFTTVGPGGGGLAGGAALAGRVLAMVAILFGLVFVARGFRRIAGPLDALGAASRRVEAGDYSVRVPEPRGGPGALRALVRAFNTMTANLERDARARRNQLADVSHELRTPLAVIRAELEAIQDGVHIADAEHLALLLQETAVLERLVADLRTVTLSEAGELALHRESTDLAVLVSDVATSFATTAEAAGVRLAADAADDLPLLDVDPVRIREVLTNLVANALRYTPAGGAVTIAVTREAAGLRLVVIDSGEGIDPQLLPHIFERFRKDPRSRGFGLGLAIARQLVEAHGGTLTAESARGQGTTMTVELPTEG